LKDTAKYGADLHLSGGTTKDSLSRDIPIAKMMVSPGRPPLVLINTSTLAQLGRWGRLPCTIR
jgi:hypothetical protein